MIFFIDPTFFEFDPLKIANVLSNGDVRTEVARSIAIYENQCLKEILGACLYKEVQDSYTFDNGVFTIKSDATDPIKNLVSGYEYDAPSDSGSCFNPLGDFFYFMDGCGCGCGGDACTKRYWKGFIRNDQYLTGTTLKDYKRSFIADYIYYHYKLNNRSVTTSAGEQVLSGENSSTVSSFSKRIDRYNEFVFDVIGGRKGETSLYRFLSDNKADYPTWTPNCNITFKDKW